MLDFTLKTYRQLINNLKKYGYNFQTFADFIQDPKSKVIILRHDVDRLPKNALRIAKLEYGLGVKSTHYFRTVKRIFDDEIIKEIADLGHEIGYHYENLVTVSGRKNFRKFEIRNSKHETNSNFQNTNDRNKKKTKNVELLNRLTVEKRAERIENRGNKIPKELYELAIMDFEKNLKKLREIYPIKTICMHGSPLSKWDNSDLWKVYDYRDFGIIGEPYFDIDYNEVLYLTDTGRRWDGESVSVRDRIPKRNMDGGARNSKFEIRNPKQIQNLKSKIQKSFHSTFDIIEDAEKGLLPDKMMINIHPQRWNNKFIPWFWELVSQNVKNVFKRYFYVRNIKKNMG